MATSRHVSTESSYAAFGVLVAVALLVAPADAHAIGAGLVTTVVVVLLLGAGVAVIVARRVRRSVLGAGVGLVMSAAVTSSAEAHAYLDRADPGPGAVLATDPSPSRLVLRFTEAV